VELADAGLAQATSARQLLRATRRPQFSAGIGAQRIGGDDAGFGPTIGISMSLPFTARRGNLAAAEAADRAVDAATAGRRASLAALRGGLAAAHARYEAARTRLAVYDAALLRGAREERESALAAYRSGDLSLLELLDFERALSSAEIERTRAVIDASDALADLFSGLLDSTEQLRSDLPPFVQVTNER
jgi:cobalt-zinc-cadmium efflux system outer membrane protein